MAQPNAEEDPGAGLAFGSFLGITILSNPALSIGSQSDYINGVSIDNSTLQLSIPLNVGWSLQVRATGDLTYLGNTIPVSFIGMQSLNIGNRPELFLTTTNQTLASGLTILPANITNLIRYRIVGGAHLLKPGGNYTTTLFFTYTAL